MKKRGVKQVLGPVLNGRSPLKWAICTIFIYSYIALYIALDAVASSSRHPGVRDDLRPAALLRRGSQKLRCGVGVAGSDGHLSEDPGGQGPI